MHNLLASPLTNSTRDRIVNITRDLIRTRSYLGFSFQDVADMVGVRKASLYHHFATKEALGVEVLREARLSFLAWSKFGLGHPREGLERYFGMLRNSMHAGRGVCPAGALAPGWDLIGEELQLAVRALRSEHVRWLTSVLEGLAPEHRDKDFTSTGKQAAYVFATCQGALLSARMTGRVEDFDDTVVQLKSSLLV